ncbi:MAG: PIN domain-containing protein [Deltaproteobacteria bacterium]|nr:PIN domain-containing protein [Deltaproteobacteria bacterium]
MKVFSDTNLFIYLWEQKSFVKEMEAVMRIIEGGGHSVATSTLTLGEVLVHPLRHGDPMVMKTYTEAMLRLSPIPFDAEAAVLFAQLRASNPNLRPPDAVQLACAATGACELFLTNDNRLATVQLFGGPKIQALADWA